MPGLFALRDEGAPTASILAAVATLLGQLTPEQLKAVQHPIDSIARRQWVNEVPRFERYGIWLDEVAPAVREAAMGVLRASLSGSGYEKSRNVMKLNEFLGELVGAPIALGEFSYQMHMFGEPSGTEPWGWQLYGHHLCLIRCWHTDDTYARIVPENSIRQDSRDEGESEHHPFRCSGSSTSLERLLPICSSLGAGWKLRTSFCAISSISS
jgi:hypothetical protein